MSDKEPVVLTEEQLDQIIGGLSTMLIPEYNATTSELPSLPSLPTAPTEPSAPSSPGTSGVPNLGPTGIPGINIAGMDLETAMMAVQSNRANLLDAQLKAEALAVQERNTKIADLNMLHQALEGSGAEGLNLDSRIKPDSDETYRDKLVSLGIEADSDGDGRLQGSEVEAAANLIHGQIDSLSTSQQMDMLRLQALSNKRNEAFEVMTNFIKKMQDSRASIIGNMR
jgi:hypothetical protein